MATNQSFTDFVTPVPADWLNNVNFVVNQFPFTSTLPYTYPGSGITQTIQNKFKRDVVSVVDFGADPTGVLDSTVAINAAITAVGAGLIYWPPGIYHTTGNHTVPQGQYHFGAGKNATTVFNTNTVNDTFKLPNTFCGIRDLTIDGTASRTAGTHINALGAISHTYLARLSIFNFADAGVQLNGVVQYIDELDISIPTITTGSGILITGGGDQYIRGVTFDGGSTTKCFAGINISNNGGVWCVDSDFIHPQNGVIIQATNTITQFMFFHNVAADTCGNNGWLITTSGTGTINNCGFSQCWGASANASGFLITGVPNSINGLTFSNTRAVSNNTDGIYIQSGAKNVVFNGGLITGNSGSPTLTSAGIHIGANISDVSIIGMIVGPTGAASDTQLVGIQIDAGTSSRISITGCNLTTAHTPVVMAGVTGTNNTMSACTGITLKGHTTTTTDAAGHILVTHGSGVALTTGIATVQNDATAIFVQASGTTTTSTFQFKFFTQAGASLANTAVTFNWLLDI